MRGTNAKKSPLSEHGVKDGKPKTKRKGGKTATLGKRKVQNQGRNVGMRTERGGVSCQLQKLIFDLGAGSRYDKTVQLKGRGKSRSVRTHGKSCVGKKDQTDAVFHIPAKLTTIEKK